MPQANTDLLNKIKLRLGVWYTDPLKDAELSARIEAAQQDMELAGVSAEAAQSPLGLDTIERYINGGQNDAIYIANVVKLRGEGGAEA